MGGRGSQSPDSLPPPSASWDNRYVPHALCLACILFYLISISQRPQFGRAKVWLDPCSPLFIQPGALVCFSPWTACSAPEMGTTVNLWLTHPPPHPTPQLLHNARPISEHSINPACVRVPAERAAPTRLPRLLAIQGDYRLLASLNSCVPCEDYGRKQCLQNAFVNGTELGG